MAFLFPENSKLAFSVQSLGYATGRCSMTSFRARSRGSGHVVVVQQVRAGGLDVANWMSGVSERGADRQS